MKRVIALLLSIICMIGTGCSNKITDAEGRFIWKSDKSIHLAQETGDFIKLVSLQNDKLLYYYNPFNGIIKESTAMDGSVSTQYEMYNSSAVDVEIYNYDIKTKQNSKTGVAFSISEAINTAVINNRYLLFGTMTDYIFGDPPIITDSFFSIDTQNSMGETIDALEGFLTANTFEIDAENALCETTVRKGSGLQYVWQSYHITTHQLTQLFSVNAVDEKGRTLSLPSVSNGSIYYYAFQDEQRHWLLQYDMQGHLLAEIPLKANTLVFDDNPETSNDVVQAKVFDNYLFLQAVGGNIGIYTFDSHGIVKCIYEVTGVDSNGWIEMASTSRQSQEILPGYALFYKPGSMGVLLLDLSSEKIHTAVLEYLGQSFDENSLYSPKIEECIADNEGNVVFHLSLNDSDMVKRTDNNRYLQYSLKQLLRGLDLE